MAHLNFVVSSCCRIQNSKNCFFLVRLQDLDFCSVQFFLPFDQGFRLPSIHGAFLRGGQGSDPPHAAGTEDRGRSGFEVWKLFFWGT